MAVFLSPVGGAGAQFCDNNGNPLNGGKLYTYSAGTTTPAATYTSAAGSVFHPNPIILNAGGRVPDSGEIWLADGISYKFVLKTSADVLIATWDNIIGINSNFVNYTIQEEVITATAGQTVFDLSTITYAPGTNSLAVYIDGVNQIVTDSYIETDANTVTFVSGLHDGALVKFTTAVPATGTATDAAVVSYTPAGTGAVSTTVQAKLRESVSVKDFGAVGDGVTDDTAAIQAALDAADVIEFTNGLTYKVNSTVTSTAAKTIIGNNASILADDTPFSIVSSSTTSAVSLVLTAGDESVASAGLVGVQVGSVVTFLSTSVRYNPGAGLEYYYGQTVKIVRIDAGVAYFYPAIAVGFTATSVRVYDPCENVNISGLNIDVTNAPTTAYGMEITGASRINVDRINIVGAKTQWTYLPTGETSQRAGVYITNAVDAIVRDCNVRNIRWTGSSWGYGVAAYGSNILIAGGSSQGCRHATDSGDRGYLSINVSIIGVRAEKDDTIPDWIYAIGTHANTINLSITGCTMIGKGMLMIVRGGQAAIAGNTFYQNQTFSFGDGEGTIGIQEMGITSVSIAGNSFNGLANYCVEIYNTETNYKLGLIGNTYVAGSTPLKVASVATFNFDTIASDTLTYGINRNTYSVRYPFGFDPSSYDGATYHATISNGNSNPIELWLNDAASSPYGHDVRYTLDPNGTSNEFATYKGAGNLRASIRSNGGVANYQANNVNLSDEREKMNFAPAKNYLDVVCSIPVQTFNYIDQNMEEDPGLTLGVVAQDVQVVAPELVVESNWGTEENPKMRLSIYQTDLQYALMKAIQELKAEIDALKGA